MNIAIWLLILVLGIAGGVATGFSTGSKLKQAEWDKAVLEKKSGEEAALMAAAKAIAKIEVKSEKHIQPVRTEIRTDTVYRDCQHSPDSLQHINALISEGSEPSGDHIVPKAKSSR